MSKQKKFGLVFEEHLPENTPLYDLPIRTGVRVAKKDGDIRDNYRVMSVKDGMAECIHLDDDHKIVSLHIDDIIAVAQFGEPIYPYLKPMDSICNAPDSELWHTLIEADNYHALQLLVYLYGGKVDCIYIDPPYNTGARDWKYNNDYVDSNDSYRHSKWCSFVFQRLFLAKSLLSDSGLIFISIDDNEYANLRLICDAIFGESNFVATCVWQKIHSIKNDAKYLSVNHDYVLIYAKQIEKIHINLLGRTDEMNARYKNPDNDPRGPWQSGDLVANEMRTNGNYDVVGPTGKIFNVPEGKHWVYSEENMRELLADNRIWFGKNGTSFPRKKRFLSEVQSGRTPDTWWRNEDVGHNQEGARDLKKILGTVALNNPKPVRLISRVLQIASKKDSIILDFFAGSGTTAQAVMEMNKTDGGCRRFILCTNNESNICDEVTYPRVKTVITGKRIDGTIFSNGLPANMKLYHTDFVSKDEEYLSEALMEHIAEMIQLEHGVKLDGQNYIMVLDDDEADALAAHWSEYPDVKALYVSKNVLFTTEQNTLFRDMEIHIIPDYYFNFELREVGETW